MLSFFCPILVTCEPCSDEEILMAVCTSDFGKTAHTLKRTRTHVLAVIVCYFVNCIYFPESDEWIALHWGPGVVKPTCCKLSGRAKTNVCSYSNFCCFGWILTL